MTDPQPARRYRFGTFEADPATGELRRQGIRVKLNAQPFQVLSMLLDRPGEVLTREEISRELWPDGTFVDFDHGVNAAVNRIREALGDTAGSPRFVETLARRGYRFVAPVERIGPGITVAPPAEMLHPAAVPAESEVEPRSGILAAPHELPKASPQLVQILFVGMQLMYLAFYIGALANMAEIEELLSPLPKAELVLGALMTTATILIPVRAFAIFATLFRAPGVRDKFLRIWPFLLLMDVLWSLSPLLLLHHINIGLALACTALLVYSPFVQRSLVLMGAGQAKQAAPDDV